MAKNLRWKVLIIVGVVALAVWSFYPPDQKIRLGLDLKGGVHLVLRVQTDDALRLETQTTADRLAEQLKTANIPVGGVTVNGPTSFTVNGVPPDQDAAFRNAADRGRRQLRALVRQPAATPSRCGRTSSSSCAKTPSTRRCRRSSAASTSSASPSRSSRVTAPPIRSWCSCPA